MRPGGQHLLGSCVVADGWQQEPRGPNELHFHIDPDRGHRTEHIFIDIGELISGQLPPLKTRVRLDRKSATECWKALIRKWWRHFEPQW